MNAPALKSATPTPPTTAASAPVETPEGANIGLVLNLANFARVNEYGFIETPYRKVINAVTAKDAAGHIAREDLEDEKGKVIVKAGAKITAGRRQSWPRSKTAPPGRSKPKLPTKSSTWTPTKKNGRNRRRRQRSRRRRLFHSMSASAPARTLKSGEVDADEVTHMDASRNQIIGSSAGLIPFIEKNYVYRSLMGSNQQRQAVPLIKPQRPIVGTGLGSRSPPATPAR